MQLKKIGCVAILGLLFGCETNEISKESLKIGEVSKEVLEATQETIGIMESSDGTIMDTIYLGEGVFAFFHPETKEFQSSSVDTSKTISLNFEDPNVLDEYTLKMIKEIYGENSQQFISLKNRITN